MPKLKYTKRKNPGDDNKDDKKSKKGKKGKKTNLEKTEELLLDVDSDRDDAGESDEADEGLGASLAETPGAKKLHPMNAKGHPSTGGKSE
jgi:hypothetical protein